jgi:hypothetical protein
LNEEVQKYSTDIKIINREALNYVYGKWSSVSRSQARNANKLSTRDNNIASHETKRSNSSLSFRLFDRGAKSMNRPGA